MDPQIQIRGNLVADPTHRVTAAGLHMTRFRIAASGRRFDRGRNEFVSNDPVYLSVVCWRQLADHVAQSLRKGDTVLVHGRLAMHEYDDAHGGPRRQAYEIDANAVGPDLTRYSAQLTRALRELDAGSGDAAVPAQPSSAPEAGEPVNPWAEPAPATRETAA
jgi:single-strand DNA-binding protein